jgi:hypothetical protein
MLGYGGHALTNPAATSSPSASCAKPAPTTADRAHHEQDGPD